LKIIVIIPTLNEQGNIKYLYNIIIKKLGIPILFVDDNSTDGTRKEILNLEKKNKLIKYLFRKKKLGIGSAHKDGIKWAYKNKFDICFTMDADRTHNPFEIKKMVNILKQNKAELIITSRFIKKTSLSDWPYIRKVITKIRYNLVKYMLKTNLDSSGGFRCYNLKKIKKKHIILAKNNGYFFLIESLFYLEKLQYKILEIHSNLKYRSRGHSKMRIIDIISALINLIKLSFLKKI
jgi:dolichol-phosphate mannosyltransferase